MSTQLNGVDDVVVRTMDQQIDAGKVEPLLDLITSVFNAPDTATVENALLEAFITLGFSTARLYYLNDRKRFVCVCGCDNRADIQDEIKLGRLVLPLTASDPNDGASYRVIEAAEPLVVRVDPDQEPVLNPTRDGDGILFIRVPRASFQELLSRGRKYEFLDFPLLADGRVFGKITLDKDFGGTPIDPANYQLLVMFLRPVADAIAASGWFGGGFKLPDRLLTGFLNDFRRDGNLSDLFHSAARHIQETFNARNCSIFWVHKPSVPPGSGLDQPEKLVLWATTYEPLKHRENEGYYQPGQGLTGEVWQTGEPRFIEDLPEYGGGAWHGHLNDSDVHQSYVGAPILSGGEVRGVVRIPEGNNHRLLKREAEILKTFASTVLAPTIEGYIRLSRTQPLDRLTRLFYKHLSRIKFEEPTARPGHVWDFEIRPGYLWDFGVRACRVAFGVNSKKILAYSLMDGEIFIKKMAGRLELLAGYREGSPLRGNLKSAAERVFKTGKAVLLTDVNQAQDHGAYLPVVKGVRTAMVVPLEDKDGVFGALAVASSLYDLLPDRDLEVLHMIAKQCSTLREIERIIIRAQEKERNRLQELAAYQLKTPATLLYGAAKKIIAAHGEGVPIDLSQVEKLQAAAAWLYNCSERVLALATGMTTIYQIQRHEAGELAAHLEGVLKTILSLNNPKKLRLSIQQSIQAGLSYEIDREGVTNAVFSIFENAMNASPLCGTIRVAMANLDGPFGITVVDQGKGIAPERLSTIFLPGVHYDYEVGRETMKGTGFGLPIALKIARDHGGDLLVESESNQGCLAKIILPPASPGGGPR